MAADEVVPPSTHAEPGASDGRASGNAVAGMPPQARSKFVKFVQCPWVFLFLLTAFGIDLCTLPPGSAFATLVRGVLPSGRTGCRLSSDFLLLREGEGDNQRFRMVNPDMEHQVDRDSPDVVHVFPRSTRAEAGLWAATTHVRSVQLAFWYAQNWEPLPPSSKDYLKASAALADGLDALGWGRRFSSDLIRAGGGREVTLISMGFVHNALSAAVFGLLLFSAKGAVRRMNRAFERIHKPPAPNQTRCNQCGYPRAGLPGPVCPECGSMFDGATGSGAAPASTDPSSPLAPSPSPARAS